ncbi:MAG: methyltransferase domain-containing protein [Verrucomicrobia bacterium]|nr:methyltransferase domain-containing protein [Verrucomicrobiota bacterium]
MKPGLQWDPAAYAENSAMQHVWARELLAGLALRGTERVLDVGCGDGWVTAQIAQRVPHGRVVGVDISADMIRHARATFPSARFPNLHFQEMDARNLQFREAFEVVLSNAALHWVDDHPAFLRGAAACLAPGGRLLVFCGGHGNAQDVFLAVRATLRQKPWRDFFRKLTRPYFFYDPSAYARWLPDQGLTMRAVRVTHTEAVFPERAALAGWFRTTWLPYTQRVTPAAREDFITAVLNHYLTQHPPNADGQIRVKMVRLEIDGVKC